jgi:hypothetical protein
MTCLSDFICYQGEDWERALTLTEGDGSLADLVNATAEMQVRDEAGGTLLLTGVCSIDVTSAILTIEIGNSDTSAADVTGLRRRTITEFVDDDGTRMEGDGFCAVYAIEVTYGDGKKEVIMAGTFCLIPEVVQ